MRGKTRKSLDLGGCGTGEAQVSDSSKGTDTPCGQMRGRLVPTVLELALVLGRRRFISLVTCGMISVEHNYESKILFAKNKNTGCRRCFPKFNV